MYAKRTYDGCRRLQGSLLATGRYGMSGSVIQNPRKYMWYDRSLNDPQSSMGRSGEVYIFKCQHTKFYEK